MTTDVRPRVVVLDVRRMVRSALVDVLDAAGRWRVRGWDGTGTAPEADLWVSPPGAGPPPGRRVSLDDLGIDEVGALTAAVANALDAPTPAAHAPDTAHAPDAPAPVALSAHEGAVLDCLRAGCTVEDAAERLRVSPTSVRNATRRLYRKLGAHSQAEAVALAAGRVSVG